VKRKINILFIVLLLGTATIPLMGSIFNVSTPNYNPTPLSFMPNVINKGILNPLFFSEFDDYFSEQFPMRSYLITAYNKFHEVFLNESKNEKVTIGKEGFYYFNETFDDYFKINTLSKLELERLNQVLALQKEHLQEKGITSYFVVVPNKATIYPEYMPSTLVPQQENSNLNNLVTMNLSIPLIDLKKSLLSYKETEEIDLYHSQDSHWNNIGATVGYTQILKAIQKEPIPFLQQDFTQKKDWKPDLARMLYPSLEVLENQYYYQLPNQFVFTRALRTFEDVEIESINSTQSGSLFVFRDSFSNALIPFLSESFERVHYSRAFPYDYQLVEKFKPEQLVIQIAERNINWLLQQTPKLVLAGKEASTTQSSIVDLAFTIEEEVKNDSYFYNASFNDQEKSKQVTAIKVICNNKEYNVFPIYQDDDFEDDAISTGFSLYVKEKLDVEAMEVLVRIDGSWKKVE
jgi:hypothetical protein